MINKMRKLKLDKVKTKKQLEEQLVGQVKHYM